MTDSAPICLVSEPKYLREIIEQARTGISGDLTAALLEKSLIPFVHFLNEETQRAIDAQRSGEDYLRNLTLALVNLISNMGTIALQIPTCPEHKVAMGAALSAVFDLSIQDAMQAHGESILAEAWL
jgi:hypothetical protein